MAKRSTLAQRAARPKPTETPRGITANVEYTRPELQNMLPAYGLIGDCVDGSRTVKMKRTEYLPMPNAADQSPENVARYEAYLTRAVFYNVTRRTLASLVGQVYLQPPTIKVPPILDPVVKDATGTGMSLEQLSKAVESLVVAKGRSGLFVDYPRTEGATTVLQQRTGEIRPTLTAYFPEDIINWRTITRGGRTILSLVVLRETYPESDDGFETKFATQYRVLRLENNFAKVEIWRKDTAGTSGWASTPNMEYQPRDAAGNLLTELTFTFVGAEDNDPSIDAPPLYDMAELNIGHYRNSADYEEMLFMIGQPTPYFAGLTEAWVKNQMGGVVQLGSRGAVALPEGGTAGLLQMEANPSLLEAIKHKEEQMKSLGAKLVEPASGSRTLGEAAMDNAGESSALQVATRNVSAAFLWCLEWAGIFAGAISEREDEKDADKRTINFELNTDFDFGNMSSDEINAAIGAWEKETITFEEMRASLRKAGLATVDDTLAKKNIATEVEERGQRQNKIDADNPQFADRVPAEDETV